MQRNDLCRGMEGERKYCRDWGLEAREGREEQGEEGRKKGPEKGRE